jgi:hypothetical protein
VYKNIQWAYASMIASYSDITVQELCDVDVFEVPDFNYHCNLTLKQADKCIMHYDYQGLAQIIS